MSTDPRESAGVEQVPTCYRHPGRETYVRCSRCERPICPDCMRDAAVGFQCVECVREGNRAQRRPRTLFGGRVTAGAYVTWTILALNVVVFLGELIDKTAWVRFGMAPGAVAGGEWYRLVTSAFLHSPSNFFHIAFNMWALAVLGPPLEMTFGRARYTTLYLLSAVGGSTLGYFLQPPNVVMIGASGAIFGLFGATFVVAHRLRLDTRWIVFLLAINLVLSFTVPGIAWTAHIGGLVVGLALALAYAYAPRSIRLPLQVTATVTVMVVIAALIVVRTGQLTAPAG